MSRNDTNIYEVRSKWGESMLICEPCVEAMPESWMDDCAWRIFSPNADCICDNCERRRPGARPAPTKAEPQFVDPRPGKYWVMAINVVGNDHTTCGYAKVTGPFDNHRAALDAVEATRAEWARKDPRSIWYAWGTGRIESNAAVTEE